MTFAGYDTRWLYGALLLLIVGERVVELLLTRRNARRLLARGGIEVGRAHYPWMVALHSALLVAAPLEVWAFQRPWIPWLGGPMLGLLVATMGLRYWAISSLGDHWTTQVIVVPGEAAVRRGPYRWFRHPNYVAVVFEVAALPLIHTAWLTAVFFSLGNALVLRARLRSEEAALEEHAAYGEVFGDVPGFPAPWRSRREAGS